MRISTNILLGFLLISALIGTIGYVISERSQTALQDTIVEHAEQLAIDKMDNIDRRIERRIENIEMFVTRQLVREAIEMSNTEFEKMSDMQGYINQKDMEWTGVKKTEATPFMQELKTNDLAQRIQTIYLFMEEKYNYPLFAEIFITNKYGAVIAQTGRTTDYRQDDEEWWQKAKSQKKYAGDTEYDESTGIYSIPIAVRINDEQGNFIGVILAVLDLHETVSIAEDEKNVEGATPKDFILADSRGRVIYATYPFQIFEPITNKIPTYYQQHSTADEKHFFIEKESQGTEELYVDAHSTGYKEYAGHDWILFVEYDTKEAFAPAVTLRNTVLCMSGAILVFALILGFYISIKISRPITKLTANIDEITKGNLDIQPGKSTIGEIQILTESFKRVLASLKLAVLKVGLKKEEIGLGEAIKAKEEAEEKYKVIFEKSKDTIMTLNRKQFLNGNQATLHIFGLKNIEELRKAHPSDLSPPKQPDGTDSFPAAMKHIETAFKKGTDHFYWIHKKKDGTLFDADVLLSKINEEILQATVRDISAEVKAKKDLKESQEKLRAIIDTSINFIGLMRTDGTLIEANRTAVEFTGVQEKDILGKPFWLTPWWTYSKESQTKLKKAITDAVKGKQTRFEATFPAKDRKQRLFDFSLTPVKDKQGKVIYLIPEARDITEEEKGTEQYLQFIEQTTDAVLIADPKTQKFAECNTAAENLLGYTKKELQKMYIYDIHPRDALKKVKDVFQKMARGDKTVIKTVIITKNKKRIPVEIIGSPIQFKGYHMMQGLFKVIKKEE